jgi:dTDP-4-amino-4,6-dideoxygalactose transaminase
MTDAAPKLIGGVFGWPSEPPPADAVRCPFLRGNELLLANGRSAIAVAIDWLKPGQVWLPSYLCPSMLAAVRRAETRVRFYEVDAGLRIPSTAWLGDVDRGDVVLFIDYFGFRFEQRFAGLAKERGAIVMEDACQALLTEGVGTGVDLTVFSPRKFLGVADGGILAAAPELGPSAVTVEKPPAGWWLTALTAVLRRGEFDRHGGDRSWFDRFRQAEATSPVGSYAMSLLSQAVLRRWFRYPEIARRRVENFQTLVAQLGAVALFPTLPAGAVPLGFPVRLRRRDQVRRRLFEHDVYPPIHWRLEEAVPKAFRESYELSAEIMTLPCDQRYDRSDMGVLASIVNSYDPQ